MNFYDEVSTLTFEIGEDSAIVTDCYKRATSVEIPIAVNGIRVRRIAKKAFLGCKILSRVIVPDSVESIDEWAFAHCAGLKEICLPQRTIEFGKGVFEGDRSLSRICVANQEDGVAELLAIAAVVMDAQYLIDTNDAGSEQWYRKWDYKLRDILEAKDDEGYHLYILCGEEDLHFDYDEYVALRRRRKAGLCIERLLHDNMLDDGLRHTITNYLLEQRPSREYGGCFAYVELEHADDEVYYEKLIELKVIDNDNLECVLERLDERHARMKAYLLKTLTAAAEDDFFARVLNLL